jgi:CO dehydrogenase maturation factor
VWNKSYIIINQAKRDPADVVKQMIDSNGLELAGVIPDDEQVYEFDMNGRPTIDIDEDNPALTAAYSIFDKIIP